MRFADRLSRHRRVALDTNPFIYVLNADPIYGRAAKQVFRWLEVANNEGVTSTVTLTELLVVPYRLADNDQVVEIFGLVSKFPNLSWVAPDLKIADYAARLRATYGLRTPDALQAATAVAEKATAFVTNDAAFERVREFETILLGRVN